MLDFRYAAILAPCERRNNFQKNAIRVLNPNLSPPRGIHDPENRFLPTETIETRIVRVVFGRPALPPKKREDFDR